MAASRKGNTGMIGVPRVGARRFPCIIGAMDVRAELKISKELGPGHELSLAILLTREYVSHIQEKEVFEPEGLSSQQYNILRILRGGPVEGYMIKELRERVIYRFADVPRLVNRLQVQK